MKKIFNNFKLIPLIIIFLITTFVFSGINAFSINTLKENSTDSVNLIFDNENLTVLPSHFRKSTDIQSIANNEQINTMGLESLNISGSQQFSKCNFPILIEALDTKLPIIIFDLRQESHGFINPYPISFKGKHNAANKGLSDEQIINKEKEQLNSIKIGVPIEVSNSSAKTLIPETVMNESTFVNSSNIKYIRIFAPDGELPSNAIIDSFIKNIKEIKDESWLHFHCKEGMGRTTTFMIFYDMMKNFNNVTADEIIKRQISLADFDENAINHLTSEIRLNLYNTFYNYCKEHGDKFEVSFSKYVENK